MHKESKLKMPVIGVIGVGGGGGNVVNRIISEGISGVRFISANTDVAALDDNLAEIIIVLGKKLTKGQGAGMDPLVGRESALEAKEEIEEALKGLDMLFIAAGMGGGTGTGAAPLIAQFAREKNILTIAVVTTPFSFEGRNRRKIAKAGLDDLREYVDTFMIVDNEKLVTAVKGGTFNQGFKMADDVLEGAISGLTNLINCVGVINLDFADVKKVMTDKGRAIIGTGSASGENRGVEAAKKAIECKITNDVTIGLATGVIINITADMDFPLEQAQAAAEVIEEAAEQADVIFGLINDESKENEVEVTVIATGFDVKGGLNENVVSFEKRLHARDSLRNMKQEDDKNEVEPVVKDEGEEIILESGMLKPIQRDATIPPQYKNGLNQDEIANTDIPSFVRRDRTDSSSH